ncbi:MULTISPECIES: ParA family protein [Agrobacterium]|uniref:ParA family protein n=1 Tax=Agrobacterium pusense TaxID=648995 RepID=A0AA44EGG3_9HYPH|nr:ParA family protein [Agrobacterium pusense]NTA19913.1 ParA family protein [Agrobacterium tumefaciens]PZU67693.1 MAG: ParA family protein [Rhizobium sp.]MDH0873384.1 ParA family protein [Agrobacterium pusense]MDH2091975.1 ParA family protein [Agrobacterium pusense]NRF07736.1 ParA family protein [Agrobacterium pusense]
MKILEFTNRKGGVGKTTLACHAAWYFAEKRRVLLVELDEQRNASRTIQDNLLSITSTDLCAGPVDIPGMDAPGVATIAADEKLKDYATDPKLGIPQLRENILRAEEGYDICIIDTPPAANALSIGPLLFATHVIAPIKLQGYSLQGIESVLQSIVGAKKQFNPDLDFLGILPNEYVANQPAQKDLLKDLIDKFGHRFLFDAVLHQRQGYADTAANKQPVWKDTKTAARAAAKEMRELMEKIEGRIWA